MGRSEDEPKVGDIKLPTRRNKPPSYAPEGTEWKQFDGSEGGDMWILTSTGVSPIALRFLRRLVGLRGQNPARDAADRMGLDD